MRVWALIDKYEGDIKAVLDCWWKYKVFVMAKDEHHAIKIAQDLWAEYKAKKEGIV